MRYRNRKPTPRTIIVKYAGPCACCGATIQPGMMAEYYPVGALGSHRTTAAIAHVGGLDGTSGTCSAEIAKRRDPDFIDLDRAYEDQCADICGR